MRRATALTLAIGGITLGLTAGGALASAGEPERPGPRAVEAASSAGRAASPGFEIEIDPELDARFGPRPVNAVQAAGIVTDLMPGARVVKVELDEEDDRAVWGVEAVIGSGEAEVDVDAFTGDVLDGVDGVEEEDD
ncbi:PepSY domain-containing protein [Streptomyces xinghaiensis]|uniref:PepSY domain-containing protein n=1 Tax=Streptomyces xinghaiensis TaxID=1038928 RepID=UPI0037A2F20A